MRMAKRIWVGLPGAFVATGGFLITAFAERLPEAWQDFGLYSGMFVGALGVLWIFFREVKVASLVKGIWQEHSIPPIEPEPHAAQVVRSDAAAPGVTLVSTATVSDPLIYTERERTRLLDALGAIHDVISSTLAPRRDQCLRLKENWTHELAASGPLAISDRLGDIQVIVRQASREIDQIMDANSLHFDLFNVAVYGGGTVNPNHGLDSAIAGLVGDLRALAGKDVDILKYSKAHFDEWSAHVIKFSNWIGRAGNGIRKAQKHLRSTKVTT